MKKAKRKVSKSIKRKLDSLAVKLQGVSPERLGTFLKKSSRINLRVSETDKSDMERIAKRCGLSITDYLTRLHHFAKGLFD